MDDVMQSTTGGRFAFVDVLPGCFKRPAGVFAHTGGPSTTDR
jgi:hypothetical protein